MNIYIVQSISFSLVCMLSLSFLSSLISFLFSPMPIAISFRDFLSFLLNTVRASITFIFVYSARERFGSSSDTADIIFLLLREKSERIENVHGYANQSLDDPNVSLHSHHFWTELIRHDVLVASLAMHYSIFITQFFIITHK